MYITETRATEEEARDTDKKRGVRAGALRAVRELLNSRSFYVLQVLIACFFVFFLLSLILLMRIQLFGHSAFSPAQPPIFIRFLFSPSLYFAVSIERRNPENRALKSVIV